MIFRRKAAQRLYARVIGSRTCFPLRSETQSLCREQHVLHRCGRRAHLLDLGNLAFADLCTDEDHDRRTHRLVLLGIQVLLQPSLENRWRLRGALRGVVERELLT